MDKPIDIEALCEDEEIVAETWDFSSDEEGRVTERIRAVGGDPNADATIELDIMGDEMKAEVVWVSYDPRKGKGEPPVIVKDG